MEIDTFTSKKVFGSNTYLISVGDAFAVIDASLSLSELLSERPSCEGKIAFVLLTHAHFDHILALGSYHDAKIPIFLAEEDFPMLSDPQKNCSFGECISYDFTPEILTDGQTLTLGGEKILVMKTPGHTKGSAVFRMGSALFTGDTVFADGGYGRTDLPDGSIRALRASLLLLKEKDPALRIYPGHGNPDVLGRTLSLIFS